MIFLDHHHRHLNRDPDHLTTHPTNHLLTFHVCASCVSCAFSYLSCPSSPFSLSSTFFSSSRARNLIVDQVALLIQRHCHRKIHLLMGEHQLMGNLAQILLLVSVAFLFFLELHLNQ